MSSKIRCPHCEEVSCDGRCVFKVRRRSFLGLFGGMAAGVLLPVPAIIKPTTAQMRRILQPQNIGLIAEGGDFPSLSLLGRAIFAQIDNLAGSLIDGTVFNPPPGWQKVEVKS